MPDDFCIEHGYEFMKCDKVWGAIPYCEKCTETKTVDTNDELHQILGEALKRNKP